MDDLEKFVKSRTDDINEQKAILRVYDRPEFTLGSMEDLKTCDLIKSDLPTVVIVECKDEADAKSVAVSLAGWVESNTERYHPELVDNNQIVVAAVLNYRGGEAEILLELLDKEG